MPQIADCSNGKYQLLPELRQSFTRADSFAEMEGQAPLPSASSDPISEAETGLYTLGQDLEWNSRCFLDATPAVDFVLEGYPPGDATVFFHGEDGRLHTLKRVNIDIVRERCPQLADAVAASSIGPQLDLKDVVTPATAWPLLRYLYTGRYRDARADVTSLSLHIQMFQLGRRFQLQGLKTQSYASIRAIGDHGRCSTQRPTDLYDGIRYIYEYLSAPDKAIEAVVRYCAAYLVQHRLHQDDEFQELLSEVQPFHNDLWRCVAEHHGGTESAYDRARRCRRCTNSAVVCDAMRQLSSRANVPYSPAWLHTGDMSDVEDDMPPFSAVNDAASVAPMRRGRT